MRALSKKMGIPISADGKITEVEEDDEEDMEEDMEEESEEEEEPVPEPKAAPVKAAATAAEEKKAKALAAAEEKKAKASAAAEEKKKQQQEKAKAAAAAKKEEQAKKVAAETKAKEAKKEDAKGIKELLNDKKAAEAKEVKKEDSKKKTLPSGLVIEDTKVGNGPRAKNGKKVSVRYIGRLTTGKVFDSNTKGAPFTFRLGGGEVIKGWDLGVQGMNVGGSRKLTIPANLAYGSRGAPPDIPKNATLEFEIKLLDIKG